MSAECAQVISLSDKQKSSVKPVPAPKNLCQPFTLRLVLGVPIIKEENKIFGDLEGLFTKYALSDPLTTSQLSNKVDADIFWSHLQTGVNSIVKQLEDAVRDTSLKIFDPFTVILLDFAWLNSQLGHHLAHICSGMPYTSLLAVSPPGKLGKMINYSNKVVCLGIRPLMMPHSIRLPQLRDFLRACAALTGKALPPDPATSTTGSLPAAMATGGCEDGALTGATVGSTPQYVPILPKPSTTVLVSPHANVNITPSLSAGYVVAAGVGGGTSGLIANSLMGHPGPSHAPIQKAQMPSKPPVPRPAVRHIPADDWLTYKLDHGKLYKCGADISKELENHSLYIHDVADIWALYPRQLQKPDLRMRRSVPPPPKSHKTRASAPLGKQRRTSTSDHHATLPSPPQEDYFDEDVEEEGLADVDDDEAYDYQPGTSTYLEPPPSRHHRYSRHYQQATSPPAGPRGMYHRKQQPDSSGQFGGLGKRRTRGGTRRSPKW